MTSLRQNLTSVNVSLLRNMPLRHEDQGLSIHHSIQIRRANVNSSHITLSLTTLNTSSLIRTNLMVRNRHRSLQTILRTTLVSFRIKRIQRNILRLNRTLCKIFSTLLTTIQTRNRNLSVRHRINKRAILAVLRRNLPLILILLTLLPNQFLYGTKCNPTRRSTSEGPRRNRHFRSSFSRDDSFLPTNLTRLHNRVQSIFSLSHYFSYLRCAV